MRRPVVAALAPRAAAFPTAAARADYVIQGHGWGHGVGLSQYGAYGYAAREGRDFRWIVGHYFTGTTVDRVPAARMRVLLRRTRAPVLCGATALRDPTGRRVRLDPARRYRFAAWRDDGLAVFDAATRHRR